MSALPVPRRRVSPAVVAVVLSAVFALVLAVLSSSSSSAAGGRSGTTGTTAGFLDGRNVTLQYQRDFYCDPSVPSDAVSRCEAGQPNGAQPPRSGDLPDLFVAVPYGFTPTQGTQCPTATATTSCVDHPRYIDLSTNLSAFFGTAAQNAFLPAHDHFVSEKAGGWWTVSVYAVTSQQAWDQMLGDHGATPPGGATPRSVEALDALVGAGTVLGPIPTNLNLFFNVVQGTDPHPGTDVQAR